jgi:hypothetical protein
LQLQAPLPRRPAGVDTVNSYPTHRAKACLQRERHWLQLRVLALNLRAFASTRSVRIKLLAKAAMHMRHEGILTAGRPTNICFIGLGARFARNLTSRHRKRML